MKIFSLLILLSMLGCSSNPKPIAVPIISPVPSGQQLPINIVASPFINPDPDGRPSPMALRIYLLSNQSSFNLASMRNIFSDDKKILGDDLIIYQEVLIAPGDVKTLNITINDKIKFLGVAAGFRQYQIANWQYIIAIKPNTGPFQIDVGELKISITPDN